MKTSLSLLTTILLLTSVLPAARASYSDVPSRYADAVSYLEGEGMVSGYPDGTFRAGSSVNRVEFLKLALRATFTDWDIRACDPVATYHFTDTSNSNWYASYLCMAVRHGIVSGYPDGSFRPAQTITLAEAAKILATLDYDYVDGVRTARDPLPYVAGDEWYGPAVRYL
ncbi:MAG: S-layer homology domain-containing protein, partial [Patescibacteria group bacterium]